jgi:hypothetical protein
VIELAANRMVAVPRAFFVLAIVAAVGLSGLAVGLDSPVALSCSNPVHGLPLVFERYENQRSGEVQFVSRTPGYTVFIEPRQVTMAFRRPSFANHAARSFVRMRMLQSNHSWRRRTISLATIPQGGAQVFLSSAKSVFPRSTRTLTWCTTATITNWNTTL